MLAMHMQNELLTPPVALLLMLLAGATLVFASWRIKPGFDESKVPLMGVMGAFVFAAQMINFPILPGTSGHLGGGVLLTLLLGPHAALLVMAAILIVQCLIFQDGGLLALGANILNLGVVPCYLGYFCFHTFAGCKPGAARLYLALFFATLIGMVAGASLVPLQVWASGLVAAPLSKFLALMIGLHLLVALGEAIITFLVIGYVGRVRPQTLGPVADRLAASTEGLQRRALLASFLVVALFLGGVVSLYASPWADALESITSAEEGHPRQPLVRENTSPTVARVNTLQEHTALLPDYRFTSLSGLLGTGITLLIVWAVGRALNARTPHEHASPEIGGKDSM